MASIGSLAYAEDDGRHILGIKVAVSPATRKGSLGEGETISCHVLECENEVSVTFVPRNRGHCDTVYSRRTISL